MISIIRRFSVIALLFGVILFVQMIQVENLAGLHPRSLISLGFIILASFALGEIFAIFKLPRVIGYILIGILFGPFSHFIFSTRFVEVFNSEVIDNISLVNTVALSLIALTAGTEIVMKELKNSIRTIVYILGLKILLLIALIPVTTFLVSPYIGFLNGADSNLILAAGLLLTVISLGTSIELTLVIVNDTKSKGKLPDTILSTAILKDVLVILLLAVVLSISTALITPSGKVELGILFDLGLELLYSVLFGGVLGAGLILYYKYVRIEIMLFLLAFIVFATQLSTMMHLETLIVFITAGFVFRNYSDFGSQLHHPLQKLSLPIFIVFFTVAGASIDLSLLKNSLIIAAVLTVVRGLVLFLSVKYSAKFAKEDPVVEKYGWLGFFSIGGLILGLGIIIENKLGAFGAELKNIITAFVAINIFLGPILFKIGLLKAAKQEGKDAVSGKEDAAVEEKGDVVITESKKKKSEPLPKFKEPRFRDEHVNKLLFQTLFKLKSILLDFDKQFIHKRFEEAEELIISAMEKYVGDYQEINSVIGDENLAPQEIKNRLLKIQDGLSEWYINLCEERKSVERGILQLEPLVKDLFVSLNDITDSLPNSLKIDLLPEDLKTKSPKDSWSTSFKKKYLLINLKIVRLFKKNYSIRRNIRLRNIAKYYLSGITSREILETINLTGIERLDTIKKVRRLFSDYFNELTKLAHFTFSEENPTAAQKRMKEEFVEFHKSFISEMQIYKKEISDKDNEISSRFEYAIAVPFNSMLDTLNTLQSFETEEQQIRYSRVFSQSEVDKDNSLDSIRYWVNYYLGMLGLFQKEAYLDRLKAQLNLIINNSLIGITDEIDAKLISINRRLSENISRFNKNVSKEFNTDVVQFKDVIKNNVDEHVLAPLNGFLENLEEIKYNRKLSLLLETLIRELSGVTINMPEKILLLEENDFKFDERKPVYKELKNAALRQITKNFVEKRFIREIGEVNELLMNQLNVILTEMRNFHSIINFHIDSIMQELDEESDFSKENAKELIHSLDEKLKFRVDQLTERIDALKFDINIKVSEKVDNLFEKIDELLVNKSLISAADKIERMNAVEKIIFQLKTQLEKLNYQIRKASLFIRKYFEKYLLKSIKRLLRRFGYNVTDTEKSVSYNYLNQNNILKLPFIYRKLFDAGSIESEEFFILKRNIKSKFDDILSNYRKNKISPVVVIGNPGSGRRSVMKYLINEHLTEEEYISITINEDMRTRNGFFRSFEKNLKIPRINSIEQLIIILNEKSKKRIIFCENVEKIFFSRHTGFDNLESLMHIIASTGKNNLWICSFNKYGWSYLDKNFMLKENFGEKIFLDTYKDELKEIILRRHKATGFNVKFLPGEIRELRNRLLRIDEKEEEKQLTDKYFDELADYADGNITAAFFFWLQSIEDSGENLIQIKVPEETDITLKPLSDDLCYLTLKMVMLHSTLSIQEHAELFKISEEKSRDIFNYLMRVDLLKPVQDRNRNEYFSINKTLFKAIELELSKRNFI